MKLGPHPRMNVGTLLIDQQLERSYTNELIGPFADPENEDVRLFLSHRMLDGTETVNLLVQDADDDAFLNGDAEGTERYPTHPLWVKVKHGS